MRRASVGVLFVLVFIRWASSTEQDVGWNIVVLRWKSANTDRRSWLIVPESLTISTYTCGQQVENNI